MKKFLYVIGLALLCFIIYISSYNERVHPDQYSIPFQHILTQPDDITCGPTCVTMLLKEYGREVTIEEVEVRTHTVWFRYNGKNIGTTPPEFVAKALNYYGVDSSVRQGRISVLKHYVSLGRLCIVLLRSGESMWHYVIVRGYTESHMNIVDPLGKTYDMPLENFMGSWSWRTDMQGRGCGSFMSDLLQNLEVYPYTFICPSQGIPEVH